MSQPDRGVVVPRGVLIALVAALAVALLMAMFLLGRQSARVGTEVASGPADPVPDVSAPATAPPRMADPMAPPSTSLVAAPETLPPPSAPHVAAPAGGPTSALPLDRAEVARYFQEADVIQAGAKYWSDPQALASSVIEQAGQGRTDAFDELIASQRKAREQLARLGAPAACTEHQRRTVAALDGGLAMLQKLKGAIESGDVGALTSVPLASRDLEREAREIDDLGKQIRQRYGL